MRLILQHIWGISLQSFMIVIGRCLIIFTRHAELAKIHVQGHLIKYSTGIPTRSKAKLAPDQWTVMPLPVKDSDLGRSSTCGWGNRQTYYILLSTIRVALLSCLKFWQTLLLRYVNFFLGHDLNGEKYMSKKKKQLNR